MGRTLVDASTLIALARIGELDLLRDVVGDVRTTSAVRKEVLVEGFPETRALEAAFADWAQVVEFEPSLDDRESFGLGPGEASLFAAARGDDLLVVDDANARRLAETAGIAFTGVLGLLVAAVEGGIVAHEAGVRVLKKLARSDFRMSVELYEWVLGRLENLGDE